MNLSFHICLSAYIAAMVSHLFRSIIIGHLRVDQFYQFTKQPFFWPPYPLILEERGRKWHEDWCFNIV